MAGKPIRVRFAPSPTGSMHVGGVRTALYNYLFAKHHGGKFILRVEDTDEERNTAAALAEQLHDLKWLGLLWDEGPEVEGEFAPYYQSKRLSYYQRIATEWLKSGKAYYCFLTDEEIAQQKVKAEAENSPFQVKSPYRDLSPAAAKQRVAKGANATVRFKISDPSKEYVLQDLVRGEVRLPASMVGDFVILRSGGMPVYNFCCALDDLAMDITHVFRGEEHLSNTLRQLMLYEALEANPPYFGHLSIILDEQRKKLSKRHGAANCEDLRQAGFIPSGILNYLALLGWSHPKGEELLSLSDLIESFDVARLNASAAIFDLPKLRWLNGQHLRQCSQEAVWNMLQSGISASMLALPSDPGWYKRALPVIWSELDTLNDGIDCLKNWFDDHYFVFDEEGLDVLSWPDSSMLIERWSALLPNTTFCEVEQFKEILATLKEETGLKGKSLFMPLRVAMIGKAHGPELALIAQSLPVEQLRIRSSRCLNHATTG